MTDKRTALITGASAGLGKEFAKLFAADKHDVVLVARSADKLKALASELSAEHGITAHVIAADLGTAAGVERTWTESSGIAVDFLVNNAGFGSNGAFVDLDLARELEMVQVNCSALLALMHRFAGPMRARKFGRILNIASTAGFQPGPYMATYYATKAFVISLSEAVAFELEGTGVTVTCHCPGATATEFSSVAGTDQTALFKAKSNVATAAEVALHAYRAMHAGKSLSVHGAKNKLGVQSLRFAPRSVVRGIAAKLNQSTP